MGDSFFGFNASMPPLSDAELKELEEEEKKREKSQPKGLDPDRDPEVYDFEALRNELDDEEDYDDNLAAQLSEDNDELNDETFADVPIDQDFDFFGNTERFTANISEEEAFHVKRPVKEEHGASHLGSMKSFELNERRLGKTSVTRESLWGTADRSSSARNVRPASADFRSGQFGLGSKFGEASPVTNTSSIWGGFGGNLSTTTDRSYSPFGSSSGNLSPFNQRQSQPPHQASYTPSPPPGLSPSSSFGHQQQRGQPVRLEDIEAELQRQALAGAAAAARHEPGRFHGDDMDPRKVMSLSEVESAIRATGGRVPGAPEAFPLVGQMAAINQMQQAQQQQQLLQEQALRGLSIMDSERLQMMALRQQELAEQMAAEQAAKQQRRQQDQRKSQYNGLMTQQDKDFINRIQLSQLASSDPYSDDFYYQVYSSIRQRAGLPTWSASGNSSENTGRGGRNRKEDGMQRLHQQLQRVLNNAKKHPRQTQVSLEGALGKITSLTVRNPRQVLQVSEKRPSATASAQESDQKTTSGTGKANTPPVYDRRRVLKIVENIYLIVLDLEQMRRQGPPRAKPNQEEEHEEELAQWNETYAEKVKKLWESLRLDDHAEGSASLIISILSVAKGKKLIPRILRHLSSDQSLTLVTLIISNFSQLQVCQNVIYPGTMVANAEEAARQKFVTFDDVELFINTAAPSLLAIISEAPLRVINGLTKLFMEKNNIVSIARTKPGLAFLTMLLSRAESLKQGGGTLTGLPTPSAEDLAEWQQEYTALFSSLQGNYASIFPSLYYLVPIQPTITMAQIALTIDDMYVWQFLAALAIGASMDQQQILVTEVRDRVMENIVLAHSNRLPAAQVTHKISNVNLFLHALGLDSSQVAIPR